MLKVIVYKYERRIGDVTQRDVPHNGRRISARREGGKLHLLFREWSSAINWIEQSSPLEEPKE